MNILEFSTEMENKDFLSTEAEDQVIKDMIQQEEIEKGIQKMGEDQPELLGEVKILTSCPSCLQGLARYGEDTNTTADYIVVELAKNLLGANWMQNYVESSTKGGIEKILL